MIFREGRILGNRDYTWRVVQKSRFGFPKINIKKMETRVRKNAWTSMQTTWTINVKLIHKSRQFREQVINTHPIFGVASGRLKYQEQSVLGAPWGRKSHFESPPRRSRSGVPAPVGSLIEEKWDMDQTKRTDDPTRHTASFVGPANCKVCPSDQHYDVTFRNCCF